MKKSDRIFRNIFISIMALVFLATIVCAAKVIYSADWSFSQTSVLPTWSGPVTTQITSGSSSNTITIDGRGYTKKIILGTAHLYTCNAQVNLINNSTQSYYESSITPITSAGDVCFSITTPIAGITSVTLSLSTAATTGGKYGTLNFNVGKEE